MVFINTVIEEINCKRLFNLFFLSGAFLLASCQGNAVKEEFTISSPFQQEGTYQLIIKRSKKDPGNSLLSESFVTETKVRVSVSSVTKDSTALRWIYGKSDIVGNYKFKASQQEQEAINMYEGIEFEVITKDKHSIHLKNYSAVRSKLENLFLTMYGSDSASTRSGMYAQVREMFNSQAQTPSLMLENFFPAIPLLFGSIGDAYQAGLLVKKDSIANPYGNGFLDMLSSIEIEEIEGEVLVKKFDSIPQDQLDEQILAYLKQQYGADADKIPIDQIPQSTYITTLEIQSNQEGVVSRMVTEKQFSQGESARVNVLEVLID